jgi:putative flippase GtrA
MRNKKIILNWLTIHDQHLIFRLIHRHYEWLAYTVFGVMTTIVNFFIYTVLEHILGQQNWYLSNFPAIFLAILFAYITNRSFVFDSDGSFWTEMLRFFSARIVISLAFEYGITYLLFNVMRFDHMLNLVFFQVSWFKIISLGMVFLGNYIASKFFVFKTDRSRTINQL